jgi:hypothetical protein
VTDLADLRNWLFKGLAVEELLGRLEREGVAIRAENDPGAVQRVLPLEDFSGDIRQSAMRALPAFLAFFCLENAVRELVRERLFQLHGTGWWETKVSSQLRQKVESRREKEGENRWHTRRGAHEVNYTDFGDLALILQQNWADFADLFPDQNWITARLRELEQSRNVIAHNNVLEDREIDRIRMYLADWIRQVG